MNALQILSSEPWMGRLGWTLLHFLWQGLFIAALYAAARGTLARMASPDARYLLACAALAAMMAAPLVTWEFTQPSDPAPTGLSGVQSTPAATTTSTTAPSVSLGATTPDLQPTQFLAWVVMVWLAGTVVFWVRLAGGWVIAARLRSIQVRQAPPEWQETLANLRVRMGLSRPVQLLVSALVQVPAVMGWLRPVVLVPVGALGGLPAAHLEALLLHELAHIRRHDTLVNILQSIAEALLFYHPAVWWISGHIRAEREMCCDDLAVSVSGDALTYARALEQWESYRLPRLSAAIAANGGSLSHRIARLLGQSQPAVRTGLGPGLLAIALLLVAAAYGVFAQSGPHPAFKTVSIQRSTASGPNGAMGMALNAPLLVTLQFVYAVHDSTHLIPLPASQLVGGPDWIRTDRFDINARPAPNTDPKQTWPMWQTLLADRFKLRFHRETRDLPHYVLTGAQGGFKPPPPKDVACVSFPFGTKPQHIPGKVDCGHIVGPALGGRHIGLLHMEGNKVRMAEFTRQLALVLDRQVVDKTAFTGEFDLNLDFIPDEALRGMPGYGQPRDPSDPNGPNIFAALEQQLGLKLVPARGPVEVLVIDRAERPALN